MTDQTSPPASSTIRAAYDCLSEGAQEDWQEHAAILEYSDGVPRAEAESRALQLVLRRQAARP